MNILQTVAIYVGCPLALYGLIALLTIVPGRRKTHPKYQPGQGWDEPAQWWAGDHTIVPADPALIVVGSEGGARGTW